MPRKRPQSPSSGSDRPRTARTGSSLGSARRVVDRVFTSPPYPTQGYYGVKPGTRRRKNGEPRVVNVERSFWPTDCLRSRGAWKPSFGVKLGWSYSSCVLIARLPRELSGASNIGTLLVVQDRGRVR